MHKLLNLIVLRVKDDLEMTVVSILTSQAQLITRDDKEKTDKGYLPALIKSLFPVLGCRYSLDKPESLLSHR